MKDLKAIDTIDELTDALVDTTCTLALSHDGLDDDLALAFLKRAIEIHEQIS